jgi:hypothetical protein
MVTCTRTFCLGFRVKYFELNLIYSYFLLCLIKTLYLQLTRIIFRRILFFMSESFHMKEIVIELCKTVETFTIRALPCLK